ncbi:MAG TPA: glucose-6-phosphate dehydrogenase assembly protein OpcA [Streptosporangiaceae bacterium]|nr:glucose-6-phosphate dehydrogenase assembly protein OpcA [Streptosporangiaceae bacterium]
MLTDLTDTTCTDIRAALARAQGQLGGPATGVVLNLIIVTDESGQHDAVRAASQAGREHPCRVLGVIARDSQTTSRLDAEIRSGEGTPGQTVLLRLYGPMSEHADSVIMPLLVPDTPVVTWWHGSIPAVPSAQPLGALAQRRITDAARAKAPAAALAALSAGYQPGDTDFSWTRATPWRTLLAATVDQEQCTIAGGVVAAEEHNPTADLLKAWLQSKLHAPFRRETSAGPGITEVTLRTDAGDVVISRPDGRVATLSRPGQPDRHVALHRREIADLLAEELRRLDPDEVYGEALALVAGIPAGVG